MIATVHDEIVFEGERGLMENPETHKLIASIMETPDVARALPIRISLGVSAESWMDGKDENKSGPVMWR